MKKKEQMMNEDEIELFKFQQEISHLEKARGDGTSLLTVFIPNSQTQLNQMKQKLTREIGTSANIKDKINRQSV